ncbi:MAG: nuclear transport factor 2 family protein [Alphaproteobacteria bacterium]|nr:nuclear transport factor 2 family protein [Alphaproteobacteria bacterium]
MPNERERRNTELTRHWEKAWNEDPDRMVDECYAPDCVVVNMFSGHTMRGREELRVIERAIKAFDGTRHMVITNMVASGDVVAVQADSIFGTYKGKGVAFLTYNDDGLIVSDHTYGADPSGASLPDSAGFAGKATA